jgi:hypothetical protein
MVHWKIQHTFTHHPEIHVILHEHTAGHTAPLNNVCWITALTVIASKRSAASLGRLQVRHARLATGLRAWRLGAARKRKLASVSGSLPPGSGPRAWSAGKRVTYSALRLLKDHIICASAPSTGWRTMRATLRPHARL